MRVKSRIYSRSFKFASKLIRLIRKFNVHPSCFSIINQVVRSSTSISANIIEAQDARSRSEFVSNYSVALREAKETLHWLNFVEDLEINRETSLDDLKKENLEIIKILSAIIISAKKNR